jgi:RNA polymerase sigma factor (sigma-70 family)
MNLALTFDQIYTKHNRDVYRWIKKIVKNDMDAEELANETMLRVHKSLKSYDGSLAKISTWVLSIATNAAIDFLRKKRLNTVSLDEFGTHANNEDTRDMDQLMIMKDTQDNPEELMIVNEVRRTMYEQFSALNETDQVVASLHYFDGLSYEEVANEMKMPLGTVKAKIHKARVALMEAFPAEMRKLTFIER